MKRLTKTFIIKTWDELTNEEKEKAKEKNFEHILESWQELQQEQFKEELYSAARGAIQFNKEWYNSLDVEEYGTTYFIRRNITNICANYESFYISDLYFETDGKKLLKYNELDKDSDGGYISILPKYKVAGCLEGYCTFAEIEKELANDTDFADEYSKFIEDYNSFVKDINNALAILDDLYDVPEEFIEDSCALDEYEFYEGSHLAEVTANG